MIPSWFLEKQAKEYEKGKIFGFVGAFRWLSNFETCHINMFGRT
jgi:hypothetical protein